MRPPGLNVIFFRNSVSERPYRACLSRGTKKTRQKKALQNNAVRWELPKLEKTGEKALQNNAVRWELPKLGETGSYFFYTGGPCALTLLGPQSRFEDKLLDIGLSSMPERTPDSIFS